MNDPINSFSCSAIVSGILVDDPRADITKSAKNCTKASLRVDGNRVFVIAMGDTAEQLLQLRAGDPLAVAGNLTVGPRLYNEQASLSLSLFATRLVDLKKRKRSTTERAPASADEPFEATAGDLSDAPF